MSIINNDKELSIAFEEIGMEMGIPHVKAEFLEYSNFKVTWIRGYKWIDFKVSDYLKGADDLTIKCLARSLLRRILGQDAGNVDELTKFVTSEKFAREHRQTYLTRNVFLVDKGKDRLMAGYDRLVGAGLVPFDPSLIFKANNCLSRKAGHCSVLMKVVSVTDRVLEEDCPDYVLDYCLYHELCNFLVGFTPAEDIPDEEYDAFENKFPRKGEAKLWLRRHSLYI